MGSKVKSRDHPDSRAILYEEALYRYVCVFVCERERGVWLPWKPTIGCHGNLLLVAMETVVFDETA